MYLAGVPKLPLVHTAACPDCPGTRLGAFEDLVGPTREHCSLDTVRLDARAFAPASWGEHYGFGLVRRGVLIRMRVDAGGASVAIDAGGAGCLIPLASPADSSTSYAFAATDAIVCLCGHATLDHALGDSSTVGRELRALEQATLARVERLAQARGAATVRRKVALLLLTLTDTLSPPRQRDRLPAGLQQRDMATLVGIRPETFSRTLTELETVGVVIREPDGLRLLQRDELK